MTFVLPHRHPRSAPPKSLARYAAIDGYRGLFVVLVMLYHFGVTSLVGGWVGINHFFVFSGFLIARMLVKEQSRTGRIDAIWFYVRRARRILPPLLILVAAVVVHTAVVEQPAQRKQFGGDAFATLGFFLNWRLAGRSDAYFDMFGDPSPLRHCWTLAVEEQFYVVAPFLILGICLLTRSRVRRAAVALALAAVSAIWTAHLGYHGIADQARLYYGTDTRAQALLVGLATGLLLGVGRDGREPRELGRTLTHVLAWVGFLVSLAAIFVLTPTSAWVYNQGGMLLFAVAAALMGFAAIDRRDLLLNRLFSWPPLVYLGRISYGLYLFHWPIHLWLPLSALPTVIAGGIHLLLTLAIASLSFRFIELPIMLHGLRGLFRRRFSRRLLPTGLIAALTAGAVVLWSSPAVAGPVPTLVQGQASYAAPSPTRTLVAVGDSVPDFLVQDFAESQFPGTRLVASAYPGCDLVSAPMLNASGESVQRSDQCVQALASVPKKVRTNHARTVLLFGSPSLAAPHRTSAGSRITVSSPGYERLVDKALDTVLAEAIKGGASQVAVVNVPCRDLHHLDLDGEYGQILKQDAGTVSAMEHPMRINQVLAAWVRRHSSHARLIDLHGALCAKGFQPSVHGITLYADGVHFSPQAAPMIWGWILPQVLSPRQGGR